MRLFTALEIPQEMRARLALLGGGVPGARWVPEDNLHLTLRFIGEVDPRTADDIDAGLAAIASKPFSLALSGLGLFGERAPRVLWAGVERNEALNALAAKIETALQRIGLAPETRKFAPHVTLAKLKNPDKGRLRHFLQAHGGFRTQAFPVTRFVLYSSYIGHDGAEYTPERYYVL